MSNKLPNEHKRNIAKQSRYNNPPGTTNPTWKGTYKGGAQAPTHRNKNS